MGLWKRITVGAVLRFAAEVVAWGTGAALLVWAMSFLGKPGLSEPPEVTDFVFATVFTVFGVGAGRGLVVGATFDLVGQEREYAIGLAVTAMIVILMQFMNGVLEIARSGVALASGQQSAGVGMTMFAFLPAMAIMFLGVKWWKGRVARADGAVFLLATAWWLFAVSLAAFVLGGLLQWQISRQPNVRVWSTPRLSLLQVLPMLIASLSAVPALRRAARESVYRRGGCCRSCGYDMTAVEDAVRCPECGAAWASGASMPATSER